MEIDDLDRMSTINEAGVPEQPVPAGSSSLVELIRYFN